MEEIYRHFTRGSGTGWEEGSSSLRVRRYPSPALQESSVKGSGRRGTSERKVGAQVGFPEWSVVLWENSCSLNPPSLQLRKGPRVSPPKFRRPTLPPRIPRRTTGQDGVGLLVESTPDVQDPLTCGSGSVQSTPTTGQCSVGVVPVSSEVRGPLRHPSPRLSAQGSRTPRGGRGTSPTSRRPRVSTGRNSTVP